MKVAIVGSRNLDIDIPEECVPKDTTMIISGAARGVDRNARGYAKKHGILIQEILPEYDLYGRAAPLKRNDIIIDLADMVIAFWDGKSRGTKYVIDKCREKLIPVVVYNADDLKKFHK